MADYGSDISTFPDLDASFTLRTGVHVVAEAVARRFMTPAGGGLFYDLAYGLDLRQFMNDAIASGQLGLIAAQCEQEAMKEERVKACSVSILTPSPSAWNVKVFITTAAGPFKFTLSLNAAAAQQTLIFGS